jgi:hypothetical protein
VRLVGPLVARALLGAALLGCALPGCTGGPAAPVAPPEPVCAAVPQVSWRVPTEQVRTPYAIPADESVIRAAMVLKTVVRDRARDPNNPWALSHAILAIGAETELDNGKKAIDHLFEEYAETFQVCGETLLRFPRSRGDTRIEPHTDLILKALTEAGISPDYPVTVQGKPFTVGHLYRGSLHRAWVGSASGPVEGADAVLDVVPFGPPSEGPGSSTPHWNDSPWALQGLVAWAPADLSWTAAGDHPMTLDRFAHASVQRIDLETQALQLQQNNGQTFDKAASSKAGGLISMTCGGAHMLQGSAYALARGFGEETDKAVYSRQIDLLFWRYQPELDTYTKLIETQPVYRTLLMMQRLKFLGHFLETTHKWAAMGLFRPNEEQDRIMREAAAQLIATVAVLQATGILDNLGVLMDPKTKQVYPGVITNEQLYLDYIGDSAHGYRGLDLAVGHGTVSY